jgi:hypothetical protein
VRHCPAGAKNHRFWPPSAQRAHTKAPYKTPIHYGKRKGHLSAPGGPGRFSMASSGPSLPPQRGYISIWPSCSSK